MSDVDLSPSLPMGREAAQQLTERIRGTLQGAWEDICTAYTRQAWSALGYPSWDAYCSGEFSSQQMIRLDREQRQEIVAEMRGAGMSTRAISSALGTPQTTIRRIASTESNGSVEASASTVTGVNGKRYAAAKPSHPQAEAPAPDDAPPPALVEALASDQTLQDIRYVNSFLAAMDRVGKLGTYDAERLGPLLSGTRMESLESLEDEVHRFVASVRKSRSALRVVHGGCQ